MKASVLIDGLMELIGMFGDTDVFIQTERGGICTEQAVQDVMGGGGMVILISKEAMDADPINQLPEFHPSGEGPLQ